MHQLKDNSGVALLLTLFAVSFMMAMTVQFATSVRLQIQSADYLSQAIRLDAITRSGLNFVLAALEKNIVIGSAEQENFATLIASGSVEIKIIDEFRKIQINALVEKRKKVPAQVRLWQRFLGQFDYDSIRINTILSDIRDHINEQGEITSLDFLSSINELDKVFEMIVPYVTIYTDKNNKGKIDINEASMTVIQTLGDGITTEIAQELIEAREKLREENKNSAAHLKDFDWYTPILASHGVVLDQDLVITYSNIFSGVTIVASLEDSLPSVGSSGKVRKKFTRIGQGVIHKDGQKFRLLEWHVE